MKRIFAAAALLPVAVLNLAPLAHAQRWGGGGYGPGMMWGWGRYGWFPGPLVMLLFWAAVIAAAVLLVRWLVHARAPVREKRILLDILKERFARGEIDKEEFESRRRILAER